MSALSWSRLAQRSLVPTVLFLGLGSTAHGEWRIGNGIVKVGASASTTYNSRYAANRDADDVVYGTFSPNVSYSRGFSRWRSEANLGVNFQHYFSGDISDRQDVHAAVSTSVNRDVLGNVAFDFSGSYRESLVEDYDVNTLVSNRSTSLAANATARIGRSLTLDLGTSYSESESSGFSDRESWNGDASLSYSIGQRNAAFVSYSYTSTESAGRGGAFGSLDQTYQSVQLGLSRQFVSGLSARASVGRSYIDRANAETVGIDPENESTIFNVSLSGPFLPPRMFPKLDSSFNISYSTNRSPGLYDAGGRSLAYSLRLAWQARLNTRVSLSSSRDRSLTVRNLTAETTMVRAEVDQSLTNGINLNAFVGYRWREQEGIERESEILDAGGGFNTALGTKGYWSLSGRYTYSRSDSTDAIADFARHIATLSLNFRY